MKGVKILIGFLTLFCIWSICNLNYVVSHARELMDTKPVAPYNFTKEELFLLQEGDIIMRRGYGVISTMINNMNENQDYQISHCAIVVKDTSTNELAVIHSVSSDLSDIDGVQMQSIKRFTNESMPKTLVVIRNNSKDTTTRKKVADRALYYLNEKIKFDHYFTLADSSTFYCSELIHRCYYDVFGKDYFPERLKTEHPDYLTFNFLLDSTKFNLVLNHQGENVAKYFPKK